MGAKDIGAKAYFSNPMHFADAFNFLMYDGERVIDYKALREMDSVEVVLPYADGVKISIEKLRDVLKFYKAMIDDNAVYLMLGIEAQSAVNYAMPIRNMLYDAMAYAEQVERIARKHREEHTAMTSAEFLSGMLKTDRVVPVITLVMQLGDEEWDGPTRLHEMMNTKDKRILEFVPDYRINIISPARIADSEFDKFSTGLGALMQFLKHKNEKGMAWLSKIERFKRIDFDTASFIETLTGKKFIRDDKKEEVNMWAAWDEALNQARLEADKGGYERGDKSGFERGDKNGFERGYASGKTECLRQLIQRSNFSLGQALDMLGISSSDEREYYQTQLAN